MKQFNYRTRFTPIEVELKGEKKYFVEGYISTIDPDESNEVVTLKAQEQMLVDITDRVITMDIEHDEWYDDNGEQLSRPKNEMVPVAKVVHAELRAKGVWAKVEINKHIPQFKAIWGSIKDKFLHSFSIAFYPVKAIVKTINGVTMKFIESLNLINITLTGSPVNTSAGFNPVMKAALKSLKGEKMGEKDNNEGGNPPPADPPANPPADPPKDPPKDPPAAPPKDPPKDPPAAPPANDGEADKLKQTLADQETKIKELEGKVEAVEAEKQKAVDAAEAAKAAKEGGPLSAIKAMKGQVDLNAAKLKALDAQLSEPVFKSRIEKTKPKLDEVGPKNPLDMI